MCTLRSFFFPLFIYSFFGKAFANVFKDVVLILRRILKRYTLGIIERYIVHERHIIILTSFLF